jgi:PIN domain nuclease of toxin-antitoxin system
MILLDTCTLLWLAIEPTRLSGVAREAIVGAGEDVFVSAFSAWEIAWKHRHGGLRLDLEPERWFPLALEIHALREVPLSGAIALRMAALPQIHRDPADRFLIATAQEHRLRLVTPDPLIRQYPDLITVW